MKPSHKKVISLLKQGFYLQCPRDAGSRKYWIRKPGLPSWNGYITSFNRQTIDEMKELGLIETGTLCLTAKARQS